jgi:ABC-type sugar transport system ATPase subunit
LLRVNNISKSFWGIQALGGVSLAVGAASVHALIGENGAGKSTLMRIVAGLERADAGEVRFSGRGVSMIHQELMPFPELSIAENIFMGHEPTRGWIPGWVDKDAMRRGARDIAGLDPDRRMGELSVAELQTVEIAKALARDADLFLMDEPTSALSARESEALFVRIADLKQRGKAIVYVTHNLDDVFRLADTVTVLRDGRHVATRATAEATAAELISLMVGRAVETRYQRQPAATDEVALEVLGKVTFRLHKGEILGLAGLMGAGRTEVAASIYLKNPAAALARGIAMVTEDRKGDGLALDLPVRYNLTLASLKGWLINGTRERALAREEVARFRIKTAGMDEPVRNLSGGNQQKVVLAKALLTRPRVLILDEPTRGIDVGAREEIYALIDKLAREGMAILLISSEMNELLQLADRILVMRQGVVVGEVRRGEATPDEILKMAMPEFESEI